jgi:hypothetical protein
MKEQKVPKEEVKHKQLSILRHSFKPYFHWQSLLSKLSAVWRQKNGQLTILGCLG